MSREEIVRTSLRPLTSQDYFSVSEEWLTNDNHFCTRAIANRTSWLSYIDKRSVWLGGWLLNGPSFILCWMLASSGNVPYFAGRAKFLVHVFPRHCFFNSMQHTHQALICKICTFLLRFCLRLWLFVFSFSSMVWNFLWWHSIFIKTHSCGLYRLRSITNRIEAGRCVRDDDGNLTTFFTNTINSSQVKE